MAAPFVAGVAALILSHNPPSLTGSNEAVGRVLKRILTASADRLPALQSLSRTGGRLNAVRALNITDDLFSGGIGTPNNPFLIANRTQFDNMSLFPGSYFRLVNDIIPFGTIWEPQPFFGNLDGNNHKIQFGVYVEVESGRIRTNCEDIEVPFCNVLEPQPFFETGRGIREANLGLFSVNHGTIRNLRASATVIANCMSTGVNTATVNAGVIAGINAGTIENVRVYPVDYGWIENILVYSRRFMFSSIGGIAGRNFRYILSSRNYGRLIGSGHVGGIAGINTGTIRNSENWGTINYYYIMNTMYHGIGGIAGVQYSGSVENSHNGAWVFCMNSSWSRRLQPGMAHIIGHIIGGSHNGNTWDGYVDIRYLRAFQWWEGGVSGFHDQTQFVFNCIVGRSGMW